MVHPGLTTFLDIVEECDNFPYPDFSSPGVYQDALKGLWLFYLPDDPEPRGVLTDSVVERMPWTVNFHLSKSPHKSVLLRKPETPLQSHGTGGEEEEEEEEEAAIQELIDLARARRVFPRLGRKTAERFPVLGARADVGIERAAFSLFGIVGRGAHMTVYTRTPAGLKVWLARRSTAKATYPGMLDQAVAGGVAQGETPLECVAREAGEEAGLAPGVVRERAVAAGTVSWFNVSDERAGGEVGLMNPGILYVYDLEVGAGTDFQPVEGDIEKFVLMGLDDVLGALRNGEFKPSCAMVMLDFLIRHGLITAETEPDYGEIVSRLHRKLPFTVV